jgi:hypothetical protein
MQDLFLHCPLRKDQLGILCPCPKDTFDEIQVISGSETFIRRVLDSEKIEGFVSGSSARALLRFKCTNTDRTEVPTVCSRRSPL